MAENTGAQNSGLAFSWFISGLGLGALIGVLYAPKAGRETRDEIVAGAMGSTEYVKVKSREVGRQVGDAVERGKGQVAEYVDRGKDYIETGKAKLNDAVEQGKQAIDAHKEKLAAAYAAGKDAYTSTSAESHTPAAN